MKIVLDIETVQTTREEWAALQGLGFTTPDLFSQESGEEGQAEKDYQKSAFDATFSRIVCIGALIFKDDLTPVEAVAWYGSNEREILSGFWRRVASEPLRSVITYNGLGFDLPFIRKRSVIHQVKPPFEINLARYRTEPVYDVMAVWANWDNRNFIKLDVLARALGVEAKSGSGSQVAEMWSKGLEKEIAEYCLQDVYVTYACYCRLNYLEPLKSVQILDKKILLQLS